MICLSFLNARFAFVAFPPILGIPHVIWNDWGNIESHVSSIWYRR